MLKRSGLEGYDAHEPYTEAAEMISEDWSGKSQDHHLLGRNTEVIVRWSESLMQVVYPEPTQMIHPGPWSEVGEKKARRGLRVTRQWGKSQPVVWKLSHTDFLPRLLSPGLML